MFHHLDIEYSIPQFLKPGFLDLVLKVSVWWWGYTYDYVNLYFFRGRSLLVARGIACPENITLKI